MSGPGMVASLWLASFALSFAATPHASIDKDALRRTVEERNASFTACYDDALERNPKMRGRVAVKFTVEETGRVSDAIKTAGTTVKDEEMVGCVVGIFKSIEFSDWAKEKAVITYPLDFEPPPKETEPKETEPKK